MPASPPRRRRRPWWTRVNAPMLAAALATALAALLQIGHATHVSPIPGLDDLELASVDTRFRLRGPRPARDDGIVIVGLDDRTRAVDPEIFQSRRGWARLIRALDGYGPRAIGLDVLFSSPELALPPETVAQVRAARDALAARAAEAPLDPASALALAALDAVIEESLGDQLLATAVADAAAVHLGVLFHLPEPGQEPAPAGATEPPSVELARFGESVVLARAAGQQPPRARWASAAIAPVARGADGAGALNVSVDADGNLRRTYGVIDYGGRFYMPMGLALAAHRLELRPSYVAGAPHIMLGERALPCDARGRLLLDLLGPGATAFPHYSAADVMAGNVPRAALADKLVLVGYTDAARDKVVTAFDRQLDGVEIHATLAHNILHDELLRQAGPGSTLLAILVLGALLTALQLRRLRRRRAWLPGVVALVAMAVYLVVAQVLFTRGLVIAVAAPTAAWALVTLAAMLVALGTEGREKAQLRAAFSQYVNDALVERILADPAQARLGGQRRELTVLFSDIRGFSGFSEKLDPETLSDFLNEYLTPMTELVMDEGGMLDKYIGDAVMAVYGAPVEMDDHARRACGTALGMIAALGPLNERWSARGLPALAIGVGLNSGPMAVGNMGSEARFDYTVMGDAVNLGARLEGLTKLYGVDILAGESTVRAAGDAFVFRELDLVQVKGRQTTARIYELCGTPESCPLDAADRALFHAALEAYRARRWGEAERALDDFATRHPDDGPARVLRERIAGLRADPPGEDWNGVYEARSK